MYMIKENFIPENFKTTLVAINYSFSSNNAFEDELVNKGIIERYNLQKVQPNIQINGSLPNDPMIMQQLAILTPCEYITDKTKIKLQYRGTETKLIIGKDNFNKEDDAEDFKKLSEDVLDLKISDIRAIGINYSADYNLGLTRLQLLNNEVEELEDFKNNITFEFVLPIEYKDKDEIATYRVKKISGGDDTDNDRIYNVSVNFHYKFDSYNTSKKVKRIEDILKLDNYNDYIKKANGFLNINDK